MVKIRIGDGKVRIVKNAIKIRKNIPMPETRASYPWRTMKIGDSFLFPETYHILSARSACHLAMKRTGYKFKVRQTKEGLCCWRVE